MTIDFDPREWFVNKIHRRLSRHNQNAIIGFFGLPGKGKSTASFDLQEQIARRLGVPFGVDNIHFTVERFLHQINERPPRGTPDCLDDAETDANSQKWWANASYALAIIGSSSRYLGYPYVVSAPESDMLTRQFRSNFHFYFETLKIDYDRKLVITKPQIPYKDKHGQIKGKYPRASIPGLGTIRVKRIAWHLPSFATGSLATWPEYEAKKNRYMTTLYEELELGLLHKREKMSPLTIRAVKRLAADHPEWTQDRLAEEVQTNRVYINRILRQEA